jgi:putative addiction module component (TIGR02574 family)
MNAELLETAKALPLPERVELLEALWETIVAEGYEPPLTDAQAAELARRLQAHQRSPEDLVSWQQIKADAEAKYRGSK